MVGLHVGSKQANGGHLILENDELGTALLHLVRESGVVGVIMGDQEIGDVRRSDTDALASVHQLRECSRPAYVNQKDRSSCGKHIIIGRVVANIDDVHDY